MSVSNRQVAALLWLVLLTIGGVFGLGLIIQSLSRGTIIGKPVDCIDYVGQYTTAHYNEYVPCGDTKCLVQREEQVSKKLTTTYVNELPEGKFKNSDGYWLQEYPRILVKEDMTKELMGHEQKLIAYTIAVYPDKSTKSMPHLECMKLRK